MTADARAKRLRGELPAWVAARTGRGHQTRRKSAAEDVSMHGMSKKPQPAPSCGRVGQYMALALQTVMRGAFTRADIKVNIEHIAELARGAVWLSAIDMPVRLIAIPEGALQGFTDEVFDWDHRRYVDQLAIEQNRTRALQPPRSRPPRTRSRQRPGRPRPPSSRHNRRPGAGDSPRRSSQRGTPGSTKQFEWSVSRRALRSVPAQPAPRTRQASRRTQTRSSIEFSWSPNRSDHTSPGSRLLAQL